jgi:cohesin complex subunit SA-1/2
MALRDVDISVRVACLEVIALIDRTGILADDAPALRKAVPRLIFDAEPKVRKAVAGFVKGLWEEKVETLQNEWSGAAPRKRKRAEKAKIGDKEMNAMLGWKALAEILCEISETLSSTTDTEEDENGKKLGGSTGRAEVAVEALWKELVELQDWKDLADYLLVDHSNYEEDMWLLAEGEEDLMIQVLIACIKQDAKASLLFPLHSGC